MSSMYILCWEIKLLDFDMCTCFVSM